MMTGAGDAHSNIEIRCNSLAGEPDLHCVRTPAQITRHATRTHRTIKHLRQRLQHLEPLGPIQAAPAGNNDFGVFQPLRPAVIAVTLNYAHARRRRFSQQYDFATTRCVGGQCIVHTRAYCGHYVFRFESQRLAHIAAVAGAGEQQRVAIAFNAKAPRRTTRIQTKRQTRRKISPAGRVRRQHQRRRFVSYRAYRTREPDVAVVAVEHGR